jgi:hypothetical protein
MAPGVAEHRCPPEGSAGVTVTAPGGGGSPFGGAVSITPSVTSTLPAVVTTTAGVMGGTSTFTIVEGAA